LQEKFLPVNNDGRFGYAGSEQAGKLLGRGTIYWEDSTTIIASI
jgi:hypothetical protein